MKQWRQWNAPLGLLTVLGWGVSLTSVLFSWTLLAVPYLSSLLEAQHDFSDQHPFLSELLRVSIGVVLLPLMTAHTTDRSPMLAFAD